MKRALLPFLLPLCVFSSAGCARGPNVASDALPLKRVVIYRNGVGYFERAGRVDAEVVEFRMRQRMVGDFLASLAIVERGGSSVRSASFPLEVEPSSHGDDPDPEFRKELERWSKKPGDRGSADELREVTLRLDGEEHDLAIGYIAETPVWRPSYRVVVKPGGQADLQAWGIIQNLSGEDWIDVELELVAGAPLAFQSTLGDPVTPPRPIVTDSGEVISSVPGGITSLSEVPETEPAPPPAPAAEAEEYQLSDEDDAGQDAEASVALKKAPAPSERAARPGKIMGARGEPGADISLREEGLSPVRRVSQLAAVAVDAGTTRYRIPNPVTIPDESATMVLLLSQKVPGEGVFLFAPDGGVPDSAAHPFRVARFTNSTAGLLERGPIAVFERGAFLGQGMLEPLPPKATATVPFALERSLAVESERKWEQEGARLFRIEAGELTIQRDAVIRTSYRIKNGSAEPAKLLVRHPRNPGARLHKPPPGTEDNLGAGHALVPVSVAARNKGELVVDERESVNVEVDWLSPLADGAVESYSAHPRADRALVQKLKDIWTIRDALKTATEEHSKLVNEQRELEKTTRETRLSLQAIEKNTQAADLRAKLTRRLSEAHTRLDQITKSLIELKMRVDEQEVRLRDAVREIRFVNRLEPAP